MKINTKKSKKPLIITVAVITALLLGGGATYAYLNQLGPFSNSSNQETFTEESNPQEDAPVTPERDRNERGDSNEPTEYLDTPISNPPANNDPYPIENEHYRIEQSAATSFTVTLYPIANNPDYTDYDAQLRAYKTEASDYLKNRYGSLNNLTITWIPDEAKDL
ncbi:hypothetical protein FJZ39_03635 [Candidatus Saccharibacteria bacterium]|nr:hypothetical protein [Candidatus Saccharibacteria bacterium]